MRCRGAWARSDRRVPSAPLWRPSYAPAAGVALLNKKNYREDAVARLKHSMRTVLLAGSVLAAWPVLAADVTPERLLNPEPQNWLMNHRTYDGQRFSPLDKINKGNVKNLRLAYAVPLGGGAGNEFNEATPLAEDGFLYITDSWGVLYKIDGTSGDRGRVVWRMDPKQERQQANRGAAFWGNLVVTPANHPARVIATDKETGKVVWEARWWATPAANSSATGVGTTGGLAPGLRCPCFAAARRFWRFMVTSRNHAPTTVPGTMPRRQISAFRWSGAAVQRRSGTFGCRPEPAATSVRRRSISALANGWLHSQSRTEEAPLKQEE
jgi:hypothetical protein